MMGSTDLSNCAVRVKEEHSYASFIKNNGETIDEKPDLNNVQLLPFPRENSAHTDRKSVIKLESISDEEMEIVFECQDIKIKINSSAVKQLYEDSKNHLQIKKDSDDYKTQNVIKHEPKAEVKQEFFDDVLEGLNLSSDCEYNEDMEIVFEGRDVKPKMDLSVVKKNDDESKNLLRNIKNSIGYEIKNIIKTETMKKVKEEILGEDAEEWELNLDSENDSDIEIVFQCEDVRFKVELPVVNKNDNDSKSSLWNIKKSAGDEIKKIIKTETMKKVKEEILGDDADEWELNLDSENDSDVEIVFRCEDVRLKVELPEVKKNDDDSKNSLWNIKKSAGDEIKKIIKTETIKKVKEEILGDDADEWVLNLDSENNSDMEIVFQCEDLKLKVDLPQLRKVDYFSQNFKDSDRSKTQNRIETTARVKQEFVDNVEELNVDKKNKNKKITKKFNNKRCEICGRNFTRKSNLCRHVQVVHRSLVYSCDLCTKSFSLKNNLETHMLRAHNNTRHESGNACKTCGKKFVLKSNLNRHYQSIHLRIPYTCDVCGKKFSYRSTLANHIKAKHKGITYPCDTCGKKFSTKTNLKTHADAAHNGVSYPCNICGKLYSQKYSLRAHVDEVHNFGVASPTCDICGRTFANEARIVRHARSLHQNVRHACHMCGKKFTQVGNLRRHVEFVHLGIEQVCDFCGKKFSAKSNLKVHIDKIHMNGEKFTCDECGKSFRAKSYLRSHIEVAHIGVKYPCDLCKKIFLSKKSLKIHIDAAHNGTMHPCDACGKVFFYRCTLLAHTRYRHDGVRETCAICGKKFSTKRTLRSHVDSTHRKIKHPCDVCGNKFSDRGNLRVHVHSVHSGFKCTCDICQRTFTQKRSLKNHIGVVHGTMHELHPCRTCGKTFLYTSSLGHHRNSRHKGVRHECNTCKKTYRRKDYLRNHIEGVHNGVGNACEICGKKVSDRNILRNHMNRMHR